MTNLHIKFICRNILKATNMQTFCWLCRHAAPVHTRSLGAASCAIDAAPPRPGPPLAAGFCRILEPKKPPNTASNTVGYCSRIPQQINMYSVRLHFILSKFTSNIFFSQVSTCFQHPFKFDNFSALSAALSSCTYDRYLP